MRIGVIADPPIITHSCAVVASQLAKQWKRQGHEVFYLGYGYKGKEVAHPDGYTIYPDTLPLTSKDSVLNFMDAVGGVDILYSHGSKDIFRGGMEAAKERGIPFVPHTFYSTPYKNDKVNTFEARKGFILYDCEHVDDMFVCNNFSVGVGFAMGKRTWFVPNGVDTQIFFPCGEGCCETPMREKMGIPRDACVFLFSGSNITGKDPGRALDAFAKFYNHCIKDSPDHQPPNAYLAMHTRPSNTHLDLPKIAEELGVRQNVKFFTDYFPEWLEQPEADKDYQKGSFSPPYTTTPYEDMGKVFRTGDVLLAPTLMEGMSTTILEAMACGLPVICSDDEVVSEPVVNFSTGLLVHRHLTNENITNEVVDHMYFFYKVEGERKRMGKNATQLMKIKYNWEIIAKQFLYFFNTLKDERYK